MEESYKTVYSGAQFEIVEKKSRFIAQVQPVQTEAQAAQFIEKLKKQNWNASHNCYAYTIGAKQETVRFSDDGEPSGTAGKPILEVLAGQKICSTVIVVTRFFGGTLLGTGGLVRAYGLAAKEALSRSVVIEKKRGLMLKVICDYTDLGKIQYEAGRRDISIIDTQYTDVVTVILLVLHSEESNAVKWITELTKGQGIWEITREVYFTHIDKKVYVFDD